jgi:hypothetical protein
MLFWAYLFGVLGMRYADTVYSCAFCFVAFRGGSLTPPCCFSIGWCLLDECCVKEPISSLALAALTRGEDAVSRIEWLTTLPIVAGVALSSYSDTSFHPLGFLSAVTICLMSSCNSLFYKKLVSLFSLSLVLRHEHSQSRYYLHASSRLVSSHLISYRSQAVSNLMFSMRGLNTKQLR